MMESESSESLRSNPTLGRRVQGWCVLLLAAGMLVTMATWSTPVAVSSLSERGLPEPAARIASAANRTSLSLSSSSSSSSSSSWPQRFEAARRHSPPGSRHSKKASGHHGHGRGPVSSANANVSRARTEASDDRTTAAAARTVAVTTAPRASTCCCARLSSWHPAKARFSMATSAKARFSMATSPHPPRPPWRRPTTPSRPPRPRTGAPATTWRRSPSWGRTQRTCRFSPACPHTHTHSHTPRCARTRTRRIWTRPARA
ncbi:hypothetical protein AALO_G00284580 [Alosa alosa]|uniref:Uncharacterized protein n=1 Tax=Alosa alosa TaxID=278164 RepID=A0AAV6FF97_9TELE|nr:hypothetical protein AALO_G00284580 [Alosa alosa]